MVPGIVAGTYGRSEGEIDVAALAARARVAVHQTTINCMDAEARTVTCSDGETIGFDVLSINAGSAPLPRNLNTGSLLKPVRPLSGFVSAWDDRIRTIRTSGNVHRDVIVGGGPAAVELALAMAERIGLESPAAEASVVIVTDAETLAPRLPDRMRRILIKKCDDSGIGIITGAPVISAAAGLVTGNGQRVPGDSAWWAGGAVAHDWFTDSGLALDERGYVIVDDCMRSVSHAGVFVCGESAAFARHGRLHSGVYAVRQGPLLAANLMSALTEAGLKAYHPQKHALAILRTGPGQAVAAYRGLTFGGKWVWQWKDRIDRRYVARYRSPARAS